MVTHAYRTFNGLKFGLISTHISSFIKIGWKMTKLSSEKAIFSTKISQAWPMVTQAYRPFNGLNFGLISAYISTFIKICRKMTKLSSDKAISSTKFSQVWPMHIGLLMDSSLGWYLSTFQVLSKLAEKWLSYHRRKLFFGPKSLKREGWLTMRNGVKGHWTLKST